MNRDPLGLGTGLAVGERQRPFRQGSEGSRPLWAPPCTQGNSGSTPGFSLLAQISLKSKELSRVFSNTVVKKHQLFSAQLLLKKLRSWHLVPSWQIDGETVETVTDFILWGSKITADGDCSYEIKRCLLFGRKIMTNLDSILKSRDIFLHPTKWMHPLHPTKVRLVKAMFFSQWSCMDVRVGLWRKLSTE